MSKPPCGAPPSFPALVQTYFAEHLTQQRALSPRTVAAYRDAFVLFLGFAQTRLNKCPAAMGLADITPELILAFLDHLERARHNTVRSRNARLAALRAFLKFAAHRDVASLQAIERALGVPLKRFEPPMLGFLSREEMLAVIGTPNDDTWIGRRDHLLVALLYNTGARVSEIIGVQVADVVLEGAACVHLHGKGRKRRTVPLWRSTVKEIRAWLKLNPQLAGAAPLLPNRKGQAMTRSNVAQRLALAVHAAATANPGLAKRRISPHTIRHYAESGTMPRSNPRHRARSLDMLGIVSSPFRAACAAEGRRSWIGSMKTRERSRACVQAPWVHLCKPSRRSSVNKAIREVPEDWYCDLWPASVAGSIVAAFRCIPLRATTSDVTSDTVERISDLAARTRVRSAGSSLCW
jgi:site-specific recombinase XerD